MKAKYKFDLFSPSDVLARVAAVNSYEVLSGIFLEVPITTDNTAAWQAAINDNPSRRDFVLRDQVAIEKTKETELSTQDKAIGFSGLVNINQKHGLAELYIFMAPEYLGQGMGSLLMQYTILYARNELNLRKINLYVSEGNHKACHFYERLGFVKEGELKKQSWHRGRYVDRYIYS
ncbi:MAG: GNAT family protein, partial [Psychrobacter sp.]|nr:GNAT family protein [Psychrobacter sp.]